MIQKIERKGEPALIAHRAQQNTTISEETAVVVKERKKTSSLQIISTHQTHMNH
jgi:hypothetical protein